MKNCSLIVAQFNVNVNTVHTVNIISVRKFKKKLFWKVQKNKKKLFLYQKWVWIIQFRQTLVFFMQRCLSKHTLAFNIILI